jgi:hypothetical protein
MGVAAELLPADLALGQAYQKPGRPFAKQAAHPMLTLAFLPPAMGAHRLFLPEPRPEQALKDAARVSRSAFLPNIVFNFIGTITHLLGQCDQTNLIVLK